MHNSQENIDNQAISDIGMDYLIADCGNGNSAQMLVVELVPFYYC